MKVRLEVCRGTVSKRFVKPQSSGVIKPSSVFH
jgi:hypothetical protein